MQGRNSLQKVSRAACSWTRILAALLFYAATAAAASAQTFGILHSFSGPDGSFPVGPLVQGLDGKWYGTTQAGGANFGTGPCRGNAGCGTVFKIGRYGALTTLYTFCSQTNCSDGNSPINGLAEGTLGSFYGVATSGGLSGSPGGTAFRITPGAPEATLYSFCAAANCTDGASPNSEVEGWDGSLHGTTEFGGFGYGITSAGHGTAYRLTPAGKRTTTHTFCLQSGCPDGSEPQWLIQGTDGNLYGVTFLGGDKSTQLNGNGAGTLFEITASGFNTLYHFCSQAACADGAAPVRLIQGADGDLYGVTATGGALNSNVPYGSGTVFKITTAGILTTLHAFCPQLPCLDGDGPTSLIQASDGNFYGTAGGGTLNSGVVFKITPNGAFTTVYNFASFQGTPNSLMQGTDGAFYGTAAGGGKTGRGGIFRLDTGFGPIIHPLLTFGKAGAKVMILGTSLSGTTAVDFSGVAATFTVNSSGTAISTTVPAGATSGAVTVTTPGGTLTSDVAFTVLP